MTKKGKLDEALFKGATINTPSMICVEDYLDALQWADSIGGLPGLIGRSQANLAEVSAAVDKYPWLNFLAKDEASRSSTSVCLTVDMEAGKLKEMIAWLEAEDVAYDIGAYRDAPDGLRIWCGATGEFGMHAVDCDALTGSTDQHCPHHTTLPLDHPANPANPPPCDPS